MYTTIHYLRATTFTKGYLVRKIVISGLVAVAAVLGGVAVPAAAMAQPTAAAVRPGGVAAVRLGRAAAVRTGITARPTLATNGVDGVPLISCVLATDCLGVEGTSSIEGGVPSVPTRIARWNGSAWKGVGVALPKGTKSTDLKAVSCKGAKSCLVVGDYYTSKSADADAHVLALSYNGTSLKTTPTVPLPKGTTQATLSGVSCVTTKHCVALGVAFGDTAAFGEGGSLTIIETWNGARWTLHTAAQSVGATAEVDPTVVSCATTAFCVLAGETTSFSSTSFSVKLSVASWNGKKLTTMKPAALSSADEPLPTAVSCATTSNCAVTGLDLGNITSNSESATAFAETWNGKTWQLGKVTWPKGVVDSFTTGVSCYAAHSCEAVGVDGASTADNAPADAFAVSFNGTVGTLQTVPAPPKGDSTTFTDVSCLPWGSCVAIGETGKSSQAGTGPLPVMTGVWNGKAWKLDPGF
jgi:hypothetical protein